MAKKSYRLRQTPLPTSGMEDIADYMEYQCIKNGQSPYSITDVAIAIGMVPPDEDEAFSDDLLDSFIPTLSEIEDRKKNCDRNYPFALNGTSLDIDSTGSELIRNIYTFLLLATRENMKDNKIANDLDGTAIFERLCSHVMAEFWGGHANSFVFGTGAVDGNGFYDKLDNMLNQLSEKGYQHRIPDGDNGMEKDGKVDVVTFIPFADSKKGQFLVLSQCKTGISWRVSVSQLNPKNFSAKYISPPLVFTPICTFMVTETLDNEKSNWETLSIDSNGILFDRCRIMQYVPTDLDQKDPLLYNNIRQWNQGVLARDNA